MTRTGDFALGRSVAERAAGMTDVPSANQPKALGLSPASQSRRRAEARLQAALDSNPRMAPRWLEGEEAIPLAAKLGLPSERALRLASEIRHWAQGTIYRHPSQRPAAVVREIKAALTRVKAGDGEPIYFTREAWAMIDGDIDAEFVLPSSREIVPKLEAGLELATTFVEEIDDGKGGRRADDRLLTFVRRLADLYRSERRRPLTYTIDPESGQLGGDFGRFVLECVRLFYPPAEIPWCSVRAAVKECVTETRSVRRRKRKAATARA